MPAGDSSHLTALNRNCCWSLDALVQSYALDELFPLPWLSPHTAAGQRGQARLAPLIQPHAVTYARLYVTNVA